MTSNPYQSPQTEPEQKSSAAKASMFTGYLAAVLAFVGMFILGTVLVAGAVFMLSRQQFFARPSVIVLIGMLVGIFMGAYSAHSAIRAYQARNDRLERVAEARRQAVDLR